MSIKTTARQARMVKCAILSPGLEQRGPSTIQSDALKTYGFDILPYVLQIDLYESIFDNTISGTIEILENIGLSEYLPIVGVEVVAIIFEIDDPSSDTKTRRFVRAFRVVGLINQSYPRHDYRQYTLKLATHEFVRSLSTRVRKAWRGVTADAAVEDILKQYLDVPNQLTEVERTTNLIDITIPNYTPLMAINYFATLAQTYGKNESNFLFYETLDGFRFTSIALMVNGPPVSTFYVNSGLVASTTVSDEVTALSSILRVHQDQSFDLLSDIASGTLRSQLIHFDFLARQFGKPSATTHTEDSRYTETFAKTTHLDKYPVYPQNFDRTVGSDVRLFLVPSNAWSDKSAYIKSRDDGVQQKLHEAVLIRNRQLREIQHLSTLLDLPGDPNLRAGVVVNVNYPSSRALVRAGDRRINDTLFEEPTPYYSGKHLVAAVHHILTMKGPGSCEYRMQIQVNRDSLGAPLIGTALPTDAF
jgi:hypothetical protein